jgi:membrane-bound lytic murein transglycosylase B
MSRRCLVLLAILLSVAAASPTDAAKKKHKTRASAVRADDAPDVVTYGRRDDVMRFAAEIAERRGLDVATVQDTLAEARFIPSITRYVMPPPAGTAKSWAAYRARFVEPVRIRAGIAFWNENEAWLRLAEERYGVPPEIVVGIVGVESIFGRQMGSFRVVDALATLAFDFPAGRKDRSAFFRDELEAYLVMCRQQGIAPLALRGSYAGAIGMPQFMPSSINQHAVDFDGDGHIELHRDAADVIGSVAHFLVNAGWQPGLPTHFDVAVPVDASERATLLGPDILPLFTAAEFKDHGAGLSDEALATPSKLALVELQNGTAAPTYLAGTTNFYAITRYNWSSYYALAVIELGRAIKAQR